MSGYGIELAQVQETAHIISRLADLAKGMLERTRKLEVEMRNSEDEAKTPRRSLEKAGMTQKSIIRRVSPTVGPCGLVVARRGIVFQIRGLSQGVGGGVPRPRCVRYRLPRPIDDRQKQSPGGGSPNRHRADPGKDECSNNGPCHQPEPEQQIGHPGRAIASEEGRREPLTELDERARHVGEADMDVAVALEHGILGTHRHGHDGRRGTDLPEHGEAGGDNEQEGDGQEHDRRSPTPAVMTRNRSRHHPDDERQDEPRRHAGIMQIVADPYREPRRVAAHEGDKEAAKLEETDRVDKAGKARKTGSHTPGPPVVAVHGLLLFSLAVMAALIRSAMCAKDVS